MLLLVFFKVLKLHKQAWVNEATLSVHRYKEATSVHQLQLRHSGGRRGNPQKKKKKKKVTGTKLKSRLFPLTFKPDFRSAPIRNNFRTEVQGSEVNICSLSRMKACRRDGNLQQMELHICVNTRQLCVQSGLKNVCLRRKRTFKVTKFHLQNAQSPLFPSWAKSAQRRPGIPKGSNI